MKTLLLLLMVGSFYSGNGQAYMLVKDPVTGKSSYALMGAITKRNIEISYSDTVILNDGRAIIGDKVENYYNEITIKDKSGFTYLILKDHIESLSVVLKGKNVGGPYTQRITDVSLLNGKFIETREYVHPSEIKNQAWAVILTGSIISLAGAATLTGITLYKPKEAPNKQAEADRKMVTNVSTVGFGLMALGVGFVIPASVLHMKANKKSRVITL